MGGLILKTSQKALTTRARRWRLNVARMQPFERMLGNRLSRWFFLPQKNRVLEAIQGVVAVQDSRESIEDVLPSIEEENKEYSKVMRVAMGEVGAVWGQSTIDELLNEEDGQKAHDYFWDFAGNISPDYFITYYGLPWTYLKEIEGVAFNISDSIYQMQLSERVRVVSQRVNTTTYRKLVPSLVEGYRAGEGFKFLQARVEVAYAGTQFKLSLIHI